ncbi:MAG: flagellum-specific ATP synthase FliI, partial [Thiobacillus sp.]
MDRIVRLREYLANCRRAVSWAKPIATSGRLTRVSGLVMEAVGLRLPVGSQCHVQIPGGQSIEAEVAGFSGDRLFIMPATDIYGVMPGARVIPDNPMAAQPPRLGMRYIPRRRAQDRVRQVPVGEPLLGRVLDGAGRPLDGLGPLSLEHRVPLYSRSINPLERAPIRHTLDVGVRAINGFLTVGRGQRLGLFAGSGVGKSVLLGMMARY